MFKGPDLSRYRLRNLPPDPGLGKTSQTMPGNIWFRQMHIKVHRKSRDLGFYWSERIFPYNTAQKTLSLWLCLGE